MNKHEEAVKRIGLVGFENWLNNLSVTVFQSSLFGASHV